MAAIAMLIRVAVQYKRKLLLDWTRLLSPRSHAGALFVSVTNSLAVRERGHISVIINKCMLSVIQQKELVIVQILKVVIP